MIMVQKWLTGFPFHDGHRFCPEKLQKTQDNGVIIQKRNLKNMDEILDADVVVNCSGIEIMQILIDFAV